MSILGAGLDAARSVGAMAKDRRIGGGGGGGGGGYNDSFLRGEDRVEGGGGGFVPPAASSSSVAPPMGGPGQTGIIGSSSSDQAYSVLGYGKTFCEDLYLFVMQLPTWGKVLVGFIVIYVLYIVFG